jgi:hypothetical protein
MVPWGATKSMQTGPCGAFFFALFDTSVHFLHCYKEMEINGLAD